ncbi:sulfite exporter TauE/SafE family protein [Calidifontibacter terrae]
MNLSHQFPSLLAVAFGVGIVVGLTGMGGGALMTPALIFLGVPPTTAVANDLVASAVNKSVGASVHWKSGAPDLRLVKLLVIGSVPTALIGGQIVHLLGDSETQQANLKLIIGGALLLTAATYALRVYLDASGRVGRRAGSTVTIRALPTVLIGAVGGLLVGITSVGSGSLIMVALVMLYPGLSARRLVGTDLVQAVPLVLAAAISHVASQGVNWGVLIPLILGGTPGTFLGARLSRVIAPSVIKGGIVIVLSLTGLTMLKVPPTTVGIIGGAALILAPVAWALLRQRAVLRTKTQDDYAI